ncbi:hypothetical protein GGR57DRAFT_326329 [Xylariaceae sp. FL1272]|nr:hypothetical protein GGR57DRAFT_326329 [Xylariaceae sp. FL1272]
MAPAPACITEMEISKAISIHDTKVLKYIVTGVWIVRRSLTHRSNTGEPSICPTGGWSLNLTCDNGQILSILPVSLNDKPCPSVKVVVTEILSPEQAGEGRPRSYLCTLSEEFHGRSAVPGTTVKDVMETIIKSDLDRYGLRGPRGLRYWLLLALFAIKEHYNETPLSPRPLTDEAVLRLPTHEWVEHDGTLLHGAPMTSTPLVFGYLPLTTIGSPQHKVLMECQRRLFLAGWLQGQRWISRYLDP